MSQFVHFKLGHYLMNEVDGEGDDLGGGEQEQEQEEEESESEEEQAQLEEGEDDSIVVTIAGEKPAEEEEDQAAAPAWVKDLRKQHREAQKELRELRAQVNKPAADKQLPVLGKKPTMDDPDIDYDADKFEEKLTAWHEAKRKIDEEQVKAQQQEQEQKKAWSAKLESYAEAKSKLKVKDYDDAEAVVMDMFDQTQQGIIIDVMDNPAHVVYALGKNRSIAEKMAAIKNPTKFLREMSRLEDTKLKVQSKKAAPPPEKTITGTGRVSNSGGSDAHLERLRADAEKTGDYSKVTQYRRKQKEKQKA